MEKELFELLTKYREELQDWNENKRSAIYDWKESSLDGFYDWLRFRQPKP